MKKLILIIGMVIVLLVIVSRAVVPNLLVGASNSGIFPPDFCLISTNDISFYYRLDEATNVAKIDATGQCSSLYSTNNPLSYAAKITNGYGFDNGVTQYLFATHSAAMSVTNGDANFTCWVLLTNKTGSQWAFSKVFHAGFSGYSVGYQPGTDRFEFVLWGTNGMGIATAYTIVSTNGGSPSTNTWYFLCAQFSRSSNYIAMSVNDSGLDKITFPSTHQPVPNTSGLYVGARDPSVGAPEQRLIGMVDELAKWNRLLATNEVSCLYHSGSPTRYQAYPFTL